MFVGRDESGKKRYLERAVRGTKREAQRVIARLVTEVDEGRHVAAASTRFGEVLDRWLEIGPPSWSRPRSRATAGSRRPTWPRRAGSPSTWQLSLRWIHIGCRSRTVRCRSASRLPTTPWCSPPTTTGRKPWRPDVVTNRFIRLCPKAGVAGVRLHDLRHFVATNLGAAGTPIATISARLGHRGVPTTLTSTATAFRRLTARRHRRLAISSREAESSTRGARVADHQSPGAHLPTTSAKRLSGAAGAATRARMTPIRVAIGEPADAGSARARGSCCPRAGASVARLAGCSRRF